MKTLTYVKRHIWGTGSYEDVLSYRGEVICNLGVNVRLGDAIAESITYGLRNGFTRVKVVNKSNHVFKPYFINLNH